MALRIIAGLTFMVTAGFSFSQNQAKVRPENTALVRPEAVSLLGKELYRPEFSIDEKLALESAYKDAKARYDSDPTDVENIIWFGRRAAYLWRYREAIELFTKGIDLFPDDPRLYRHRGHRFITIREFDKAIADLRKAAELVRNRPDEVEPDGQPNEKHIPTSTLQSNIWYHLGLAHYLKADFQNALDAYQECSSYADNDDMLCATSDWLFMTLRRLGRTKEAQKVLERIDGRMNIIENFSYHKRLLMYKGAIAPDSLLKQDNLTDLDLATQGYGVANWHLYNGRDAEARLLFNQIISGSYWAAFGYIAAEAELARRQ